MMLRGKSYSSNPCVNWRREHKRQEKVDKFLYSIVVGLVGFGCGIAATIYIFVPYFGLA